MAGGLQIELFGRLAARNLDGELAIRGARRRALLARLAVAAGRVVSSGQLELDVWGVDTAPAPTTLPTQIFRLRRDLGASADAVVQKDDGYVLDIEPENVDLTRFEKLMSVGFPTVDGDALRRRLRETLAIWTGPALDEFADSPWARAEAARVEALALSTLERCVELELELGRHDALVSELTGLVDSHPYRERLWAALMLALYRCGRQREALDAAQRLRRTLREDLGIAPGTAVAELERRMLVQDVTLDSDTPRTSGTAVVVALALRAVRATARAAVLQDFRQAAHEGGGEHGRIAGLLPHGIGAAAAVFPDATTAATMSSHFYDELPDDIDAGLGIASDNRHDAAMRRAVVLAASARGVAVDAGTVALLRHDPAVEVVTNDARRLIDLGPPREFAHLSGRRQFEVVDPLLTVRTSLPVTFSSLVGRDDDIARLHELIASGRVVTLLGPGGVGKTRLALQVAAAQTLVRPGGVWFVELDTAAPAEVTRADLPDTDGAGPKLLVLDCCDRVAPEACRVVEELLANVADLAVLVTSREPLRSAAEQLYSLEPLDTKSEDSAAVLLFAERASAADPSFAVTPATASRVSTICRRLDGMPLAIELAAMRLVDLDVGALEAGLGDVLAALGTGPRTAAQRQQTLTASLAWGHDLLTERDQHTLEALSVFAGRFRADDVSAVFGADARLEPLIDRGFVKLDGDDLRLLDTVRAFAAGRLEERGDVAAVRGAHLRWIVERAQSLGPAGEGWESLGASEPDAVVAMQWCAEVGRPHDGAIIATALHRWWSAKNPERGKRWTAHFLAEPSLRDDTRGYLLAADALLALNTSDCTRAAASAEAALVVLPAGAAKDKGAVLNTLAAARYGLGEIDETERVFLQAIELLRDDPTAAGKLGTTLCNVAILKHDRGDLNAATAYYEEAMDVQRAGADRVAFGRTCANAGTLWAERGDTDRAIEIYNEGINVSTEAGDLVGAAMGAINLANVYATQDDLSSAHAAAVQALTQSEAVHLVEVTDTALHLLAELAIAGGELETAIDFLKARSIDPKPEVWDAIRNELGASADELWSAPAPSPAEIVERLTRA